MKSAAAIQRLARTMFGIPDPGDYEWLEEGRLWHRLNYWQQKRSRWK